MFFGTMSQSQNKDDKRKKCYVLAHKVHFWRGICDSIYKNIFRSRFLSCTHKIFRKHQRGNTTILMGILLLQFFATIYLVGPSQWDAFQMRDVLRDVGWKWKETYSASAAKQN